MRQFLALSFTPLLACLLAVPALAQDDDPEKTAAKMITPATDEAIDKGLAYLAGSQLPDGSFGTGGYRGNVAICALAGMAFMSGGSTPDRGPYGENVRRCLDFILKNTQPSGFIIARGSASHGPMYGHGFATLFLAECYGMSHQADLREKLKKAVGLIVNTQNAEGGWRYEPQKAEADLSVTICEVMALRSARNAGIHVPRDCIDRTIDYVKQSQNPDGGFMYMHPSGESGFARSAAGVVALYSAGVYEGPEIDKGIEYLLQYLPTEEDHPPETYRFYGHYYAVQAMWHAGGEPWRRWYPAVRDELIADQETDGSWFSPISSDYSTAMVLIVLQMPNNYLPIFQK